MELKGYSQPTCNKLCVSSHDAVYRRRVSLITPSTCRGEIFEVKTPEFAAKFQKEVPPLIFGDTRISL